MTKSNEVKVTLKHPAVASLITSVPIKIAPTIWKDEIIPAQSIITDTTSATLSWNKVQYATRYSIELKAQNENKVQVISDILTNSYSLKNLEPNKTYEVVVKAWNMSASKIIQTANFKTKQVKLGEFNVITETIENHRITLKWEPVVNAKYYSASIMLENKEVSKINNINTNSICFENLEEGKEYKIVLTAINPTGEDVSINRVVRTKLSQNSRIKQRFIGSNLIAIEWTPTKDAISYRIIIDGSEVLTVNNAVAVIDRLKENTIYKLTIFALDSNGRVIESINSNIKTL